MTMIALVGAGGAEGNEPFATALGHTSMDLSTTENASFSAVLEAS